MTGLAVIGAGAFGTSLAIALSRDGTPVTLVPRSADHASSMAGQRANPKYLPGVEFPESLGISLEIDTVVPQITLLAVPMQALSAVAAFHAKALADCALVACCKGLDLDTHQTPSVVLRSIFKDATIATLTGPGFAADIGAGLPTALTLACEDLEAGRSLQRSLARNELRPYLSHDVIGAELGGALKNVIALAAGMAIGSDLGESARASVITRGFAEMQRIALALGGEAATLSGLSGLGDLVLTCTSHKSRNFSAGVTLGSGEALPGNKTIEGIATARAMAILARSRGIEAPLTTTIADVLDGAMTVARAREQLLSRPLRLE